MRTLWRRPSVWFALVAVVLGGSVVLARARGAAVRTVTVAVRDLEQHIVATGRVWVAARVQVSTQTPGMAVAVGAVEGQRVKAGDLLVQLDDSEARAALAQAQAAADQAGARVEQLRRVGAIVASEGLRQAEANVARAETELARTEQLAVSGALPKAQLEDARRAADVARAQKAAAQVQQISAAPLGADSRVAMTALLQAQAQLAGARVRLAQTRVVALSDGVVLTRSVEPGDVVQPSRTLLVVAVDADPQLVFQPDERNLAFLAVGQRGRASADAFPEQLFDAEVSYVAPSVDPQRGSVEVRLRVPKPPAFLRPDMTVSIDLTVAAKRSVLTLPSDVVHGAFSREPWVWLSGPDGRALRRPVTLGIRGEGAVEVVSGLTRDDRVLAVEATRLSEGQRVRPESE